MLRPSANATEWLGLGEIREGGDGLYDGTHQEAVAPAAGSDMADVQGSALEGVVADGLPGDERETAAGHRTKLGAWQSHRDGVLSSIHRASAFDGGSVCRWTASRPFSMKNRSFDERQIFERRGCNLSRLIWRRTGMHTSR
jgi:hypothetical protein